MKKLFTLLTFMGLAATASADGVTFTARKESLNKNTASRLFDGSASTNQQKWEGDWNGGPHYVLFEASEVIYVNGVTITTGADDATNSDRSLREWELYGSNTEGAKEDSDHSSWTLIQHVYYAMPAENAYDVKFPFNPSQTSYRYFKFLVKKINGGNYMQIGELALDYSTVAKSAITTVANGGENKTDTHDERAIKVFDGTSSTKWYYGANTNFVVFKTPKPVSLKSYVIQTANDSDDRDPKTFKLYGAHVVAPTTNGNTDGWTLIDSENDASSVIPTDRYAYVKFTVDSSDDFYQYYMLKIEATRKNWNAMQISEIIMYEYEEQAPVVISSPADIEGLASRVNAGETSLSAKMTDDIDMAGVEHTSIGTSSNKYAGTFDGQEHVIENLSLSASSGSGVGFFGYTNSATIQDVEFLKANVNVTGGNNTGIVVGICDGGTIQRCAVVNSYINGNDHTGSIAGCAKGSSTISNCYSNAKVKSVHQAGGMVGTSEGMTIEKCIFMGPSVEVSNSEATAAGLISRIEGSGSNTTMRNNLVATQRVYSSSSNYNNKCRSLTSDNTINGYGGTLNSAINNYSWKTTKYGDDHTYTLTKPDDINGGQKELTEINSTFFSETLEFDITETWKMVDGLTYAGGSYPILKWMSIPASVEISTSKELTDFSTFMWDNQNATLTQDIVADENYAPMGNEFRYYYGTFDGQGHDVTLALTGNKFQGLFGCAKDNAVFRNIVIKGSVSGTGNCAALVGEVKGNHGTITISRVGCEANVTSTGGYNGAFVGNNWGGTIRLVVENSYNIGDIEGGSNTAVMGGYAKSTSTYTNVYNKGTITGGSYPFVHENKGVFTNCYTASTESTAIPGLTQQISSDMITSGELCSKLGEAFTQVLGKDNYPTLDSSKPNVYEMTVGTAGWASFVPEVDIATLPTGVTAYVGQIQNNGSSLHLEEVTELPADNAFVVNANAGDYYYNNTSESITLSEDNDLAFSETNFNSNGTQYCLANKEPGVGFYQVQSGITIPARKVYLTVPSPVKAFYGFEEDDADGISCLTPALSKGDGAVYNLAGQKLSKMQKGINIVNGKKIMK